MLPGVRGPIPALDHDNLLIACSVATRLGRPSAGTGGAWPRAIPPNAVGIAREVAGLQFLHDHPGELGVTEAPEAGVREFVEARAFFPRRVECSRCYDVGQGAGKFLGGRRRAGR